MSCINSKREEFFHKSGESASERHSVVSDSLQPYGPYSPWNSPGQHTGLGSLSLLQGTFPTQGLNPGLPHCRQILYQLSHKLWYKSSSGKSGSTDPSLALQVVERGSKYRWECEQTFDLFMLCDHRTGKGQFSSQSQRKAMPNNIQTTAQLHSSHTLAKRCSKFSKPGLTVHELWTSRYSSWI